MIDTDNVRIFVCPLDVFMAEIVNGDRREVCEPNEREADELRRCFSDARVW